MNPVKLREITTNAKEIREISAITAKVLAERSIVIGNPEILPTMVFEYIRTAMQYVKELAQQEKSDEVTINFMELFTIGVHDRVTDEGEKGMNIVPILIPGTHLQIVAKDDREV